MSPDYPFKPADFFAFRTALLPFLTFEDWGRDMVAIGAPDADLDAAVASDEALLRQRLQRMVRDPILREALFLASPDLTEALRHWYADPQSTKGRRAERTVVKYVSRLCGRSTPFGLFAGCSVGRLGSKTRIATLPPENYIRHTRPDMDYLCNLAAVLIGDPTIARLLTYTKNTSLYVATGRLHYCEARQKGKQRSYHLVAVDQTAYLDGLLALATKGASFGALAASLVDDEITLEEAEDFIQELIQNQILLPDLEPAVTGPEPLHAMITTLAALSHEGANTAAKALAHVRDELASIDASPLGIPTERYEALAERLRALPAPVEMNRLFQTDLVKPAPEAEFGGEVMEELQAALDILWRLQDRPDDPFKDFKQAFLERYEGREVPLTEVLDEESGIGFGPKGGTESENAPLLDGLPFPGRNGESQVHWGSWENWQHKKLLEHQASRNAVLTVTQSELEPFLTRKLERMPDAFSVVAKVATESQEALDGGRFRIYLTGGAGPSGANLLGRFCHGDSELTGHLEAFLKQEEAYHPGVVYAEIVHLPAGRIGNVILRPTLREYEIPFLGRSGVDGEHQIPLSDLLVSIRGERVVLRSRRLGMEVAPRLTNAHNFQARGLGAYRFLCMFQFQEPSGRVGWNWGPLGNLPFLPRVELGRTVLSKARWLVKSDEIKCLAEAKAGTRTKALREWMAQRGLPHLVLLADGDNKLPVDFHNALSVDAFLDLVKERPNLTLEEFYPHPSELGAFAPEGSFIHELVLPFLAVRDPQVRPTAISAAPTIDRSFPPGSEWLYAKIYTGHAGADTLLRGPIPSLVQDALESGDADGWFFIRYTDPDHHLRLRFHGDPRRLCAEVLPRLQGLLKPHLANGQVSKVMLDTYHREVERYGMDAGMPLCEAIFRADSELVLGLLQHFRGDAFADQRWRLTLASSDRLLQDFGYEIPDRLRLITSIRDNYRREFAIEGKAEHPYGKRFRQERKDLETLLWDPDCSLMKQALPIFDTRSQAMAGPISALRALSAGPKGFNLDGLLPSLIHMISNRLLRAAQRPQELAIADFMVRAYESRIARNPTIYF